MTPPLVAGWDVGGVNIKCATVVGGRVTNAQSKPFEIQRSPAALVGHLQSLAKSMSLSGDTAHAVTMTAELSQLFRTKREGVAFVLDALDRAFLGAPIHVYTVDGTFLPTADARANPMRVAASNWHATASIVAHAWPDAILVDIGSTTTDIIPLARGLVAARGHSDPQRLSTAELLYLGAVRTPVEAIVQEVPLGTHMAGVSAESFALSGDVHTWLGDLPEGDYTTPTPDGRPVTREFVRERLARIVCADRELLDDRAIDDIARHVATAQVSRTARALARVRGPDAALPVVAAGIGAFLARRAASLMGAPVADLADLLGTAAARAAPAAAVALLLASRDQP
ncbi:MAG TPA: hydantoinase/oxoprolinase family protein [Gemmatimonadaceae bacterium]|jgi:hypothetical protein